MPNVRNSGMLVWLTLSVLILVSDQVTKYLADEYLSYGIPVKIFSFFNLTLAYNSGAAFSFLADAGGWQRWFFAIIAFVVSVVLVILIKQMKPHEVWSAIALSLILGGAVGNLYDRVALGHVIDFISVHYKHYYFPAFNIADSAISVGAVMWIIDTFKRPSDDNSSN
jgi:signal peptidase II